MREEVAILYREVMNLPLSESRVQRGAEIVASLDRDRKKRMSEAIAEEEASVSQNRNKDKGRFKKILNELALKAEKLSDC